MTYDEFKSEMTTMFKQAMKYTPMQAGSRIWTDRMADLADEYPAYDAQLEDES